MPSDDLTPAESAVLIVLLAEGRDISNKELKERFGMTLTGKSREKLNGQGLVKSWKVGRAYMHRLDDAGWDRCTQPLNFASPRARALGAALSTLFAAVHRDLVRTNRSLAMAFASESTPVATDSPAAEPAPVASPSELIDFIRVAYKARAQAPGDWVNIADIRDELGVVDRQQLDAALKQLEQEPDVNIVPQANEKALSERTRQAAVIIGRQPKHFIAIGV
jgi:hypothetical protein